MVFFFTISTKNTISYWNLIISKNNNKYKKNALFLTTPCREGTKISFFIFFTKAKITFLYFLDLKNKTNRILDAFTHYITKTNKIYNKNDSNNNIFFFTLIFFLLQIYFTLKN